MTRCQNSAKGQGRAHGLGGQGALPEGRSWKSCRMEKLQAMEWMGPSNRGGTRTPWAQPGLGPCPHSPWPPLPTLAPTPGAGQRSFRSNLFWAGQAAASAPRGGFQLSLSAPLLLKAQPWPPPRPCSPCPPTHTLVSLSFHNLRILY